MAAILFSTRPELNEVTGPAHDILGRLTADAVTLAAGNPQHVDGSILRLGTTYNALGAVETLTSYSAATGGSVVNQIQREYNGLGQLTREYQSHTGAVNTSTTPHVDYTYGAPAQGARLTVLTYPNGRVLNYNYGTSGSVDDSISRKCPKDS